MKKNLQQLAKSDDKTYSNRAVVTKIYRVKEQLEDFNLGLTKVQYNQVKHLQCDVRITRDGTDVYGVLLSPHILKRDSSGTITDTIYDGSVESPTGTVPVQVPLVGSYVFISWLDRNTAFVSMQTSTENIIVGSTEGAYFDFYNREDTRILDLKNADEFNISLNNGKTFNVKTDSNDFTTWLVLLEQIVLSIENAQIVIETVDNVPLIRIETDGGKISIKNDKENLNAILNEFIDTFIKYVNGVTAGLSTAQPSLAATMSDLVSKLGSLKGRVDLLLK